MATGGAAPRSPADVPTVAHLIRAEPLDARVVLVGAVAHHLGRVLRARPGDTVTLSDGRGRWRAYTVTDPDPSALLLAADGPPVDEPRPATRIAVAFGLTKGAKPDLVVQKLTELGVDRILPLICERSVVRLTPPRAGAALGRWETIARAACEQARRAWLPTVEAIRPLAAYAGAPNLIVATRGGGSATQALAGRDEVIVVVGPEGGLSPEEVEFLQPTGTLGLAAPVLRAETAAIAAAAALVHARLAPA